MDSGAILALSPDLLAAGFDCSRAASTIEKTSVSDGELSDLDGRLTQTYRHALERTTDPERLKSEQRSWLRVERNKCADVPCLKKMYERRLSVLQAAGSAISDSPSSASTSEAVTYSFTRPPFISPLIIEDLWTWNSDHGDQIVAINLTDSQGSNRYFGKFEVDETPGKNPYVFVRRAGETPQDEESVFGYRYVGKTSSGIDVLLTIESGGGSGRFEDLMLVRLESDDAGSSLKAIDRHIEALTFTRKRLLIKKLGTIGVGDRWEGQVKVSGNEILIGKDTGIQSKVDKSKPRVIKVDLLR